MRCVLLCHTESTPWQCSIAISSLIIAKMSIFLMFILHICEKYFMWKNVSKRDFCIINLLRSSPLEWHIFVKLSIWAYAWEFGLNSFFVDFNKKRISFHETQHQFTYSLLSDYFIKIKLMWTSPPSSCATTNATNTIEWCFCCLHVVNNTNQNIVFIPK